MGLWSKGVRIVLFSIAALVVGGLALLVVVLWAMSPGKPRPFLDDAGRPIAGSISEKIHVPINGVDQGMFIAGRDRTRPVLLFVHGGPAMPEYWLSQRYASVLEDLFVVCWWEQRGAGISNTAAVRPESLTMEQLVSDTLEVTDYLRERFGQDRIYLMGHSWGTILALQAAARAPERYRAYIAVSQVAHQLESEKLAYKYMLEKYGAAGDAKMVRALEAIPLPELDAMPAAYRAVRDDAMHGIGVGTTHEMRSVVSGVFVPSLVSPVYTLGEKLALWRGKWSAPSTAMWNRMLPLDLTTVVPRLALPVYFLHGAFDYTVAYPLTKEYFAKLEAPGKGFYTFEHSAHTPIFEELERTRQILRDDVLAGTFALADTQ